MLEIESEGDQAGPRVTYLHSAAICIAAALVRLGSQLRFLYGNVAESEVLLTTS